MADVIKFGGLTTLDISPDQILQSAIGNLTDVVICGYDKNGNEYFASSIGDSQKSAWLAKRFEHFLLTEEDEARKNEC